MNDQESRREAFRRGHSCAKFWWRNGRTIWAKATPQWPMPSSTDWWAEPSGSQCVGSRCGDDARNGSSVRRKRKPTPRQQRLSESRQNHWLVSNGTGGCFAAFQMAALEHYGWLSWSIIHTPQSSCLDGGITRTHKTVIDPEESKYHHNYCRSTQGTAGHWDRNDEMTSFMRSGPWMIFRSCYQPCPCALREAGSSGLF